MQISSLFNQLANATNQTTSTGSHVNPLSALTEALDLGIVGDLLRAADGGQATGGFSLENPDFGGLLGTGLQAALAGLGPLGAIASNFLGDGLKGKGGGLGKALSGIGKGIKDTLSSIGDALSGKKADKNSRSGSSRSRSESSSKSKSDSGSKGGEKGKS